MENYYEVLGLNENASQEEIKKAYKQLAKTHHPDKGGDEEQFKKISEAFDTLGNPNKKAQYDNSRNNPFGGFNPFGDMFNMFRQQTRTVPDKVINVDVTVIESYLGSDKQITYNKEVMCETCSGHGGEKQNCHICNGRGFTTTTIGGSMFSQTITHNCNNCAGSGKVYKTVCNTCNGKTTTTKLETIKVNLPHSVDESQFLKLQGYGDFHNGMYGNLILKINIIPVDNFEKMGNDLIYNVYYTLDDITSGKLEIPHPSGTISINLPEEFDTSKPLRIQSKGFNGGDLFIKQFVRFKRMVSEKVD